MKQFLIIIFTLVIQFLLWSQNDNLQSILNSENLEMDEKLKQLDDMAWEYMYVNTDTSLQFSKSGLELSQREGQSLFIPDFYNTIGVAFIVNSNYDSAIFYLSKGLESAKALRSELNSDSENRQRLDFRLVGLLSNIGNCYYHTDIYQMAINHYMSALNELKAYEEPMRNAIILSSIGSAYMELKKLDLSLEYQLEALDYVYQSGDSSTTANILSNLGKLTYLINDFKESKKYNYEAIEIYEKLSFDYYLPVQYLNLAQIYIEQDSLEKSDNLLVKAKKIIEKYPEVEANIFYHSLKGKYYNKINSIDSATYYTYLAHTLAEKDGFAKYKLSTTETLEKIYLNQNQYDSAYKYLALRKELSEQLFTEESDKRITEMEVLYQLEKKEVQIENLEKQGAYEKQIRYLLIILLGVVVVSSIIIIISYVLRRKKTKQLHKAEKKLMQSELEKGKIEQQKMNEDLEHKSKQLTTHALNMMQKNKLLQEVNKSIEEIVKNPDKELENNFRTLKRQINRSIKADDDWEVFKMYFVQINSTFFEKLKEINPDLTKHDLRLCALIKLNLNIKESAAVLNLSPNSIKSARYKLRKRLNLEVEQDLYEFIQRV